MRIGEQMLNRILSTNYHLTDVLYVASMLEEREKLFLTNLLGHGLSLPLSSIWKRGQIKIVKNS